MKELRQFYRAPASQKIELVYQGRSLGGCLENLSLNGALLRLEEPPAIASGAGCLLRIRLAPSPASRPPLQLWSEVVHGSCGLLGVKFMDSDAEAVDCLQLLMELMRGNQEPLEATLGRVRGYLADYCGAH